jgi:chaperonin GroES
VAQKTKVKAKSKKPTAKKNAPVKKMAKKPASKITKKSAPAKKAAPKKSATPKKAATKTTAKAQTKLTPKKSPVFSKSVARNFFQPLDNRILVDQEGFSDRTAGGLYIPDGALDRNPKGRVLAVGPGSRTKQGKVRHLDVKIGDEIMYSKWSGTKIEWEGREFVILREEEVLGIINS